MSKLDIDVISQSDRRFFERFPNRKYRLRLAHRAEVEQFTIIYGLLPPPPPLRVAVAVKNVAPGARLRVPVISFPNNDLDDRGEEEAQFVFETYACDYARWAEDAIMNSKAVRQ